MKIYILLAYPDCHKWREDALTLGLFTSKTALRKAVKKHKAELGVYDEKELSDVLTGKLVNGFWYVNGLMDTGEIETINANEVYPNGIF